MKLPNLLSDLVPQIALAVRRARFGILTIALAYGLSLLLGMAMVHAGNKFALDYRDGLVGRARASDQVFSALNQGQAIEAALLDFRGNLIAASSSTLMGLGVVMPYPVVAFRGWVGGIVSVNDSHASRLADPYSAFYYLLTLVLQLIP